MMMKARPYPLLWARDEATFYWVAMQVLELFNPFLFGDHIEIVVSRLPKGFTASSQLS